MTVAAAARLPRPHPMRPLRARCFHVFMFHVLMCRHQDGQRDVRTCPECPVSPTARSSLITPRSSLARDLPGTHRDPPGTSFLRDSCPTPSPTPAKPTTSARCAPSSPRAFLIRVHPLPIRGPCPSWPFVDLRNEPIPPSRPLRAVARARSPYLPQQPPHPRRPVARLPPSSQSFPLTTRASDNLTAGGYRDRRRLGGRTSLSYIT